MSDNPKTEQTPVTTSQPHAINHGCTGRRRGSGDLADHRVKRRPKRRPSFGLATGSSLFYLIWFAFIGGLIIDKTLFFLRTTTPPEPRKEPTTMTSAHTLKDCPTHFITTHDIPTMTYWTPALSLSENLSLARQISENMDPPPELVIIYGQPGPKPKEVPTEEPELPNKQDDLDEENQENQVPCER